MSDSNTFNKCDSILITTKKMLGMGSDYNAFDFDIIANINSVFLILNQLGVGPKLPFTITGESETWSDFWGDLHRIELVRTYMYLKIKILFDPPATGVLNEALERQIKEVEWRLLVEAEVIKGGVDPYGEDDMLDGLYYD